MRGEVVGYEHPAVDWQPAASGGEVGEVGTIGAAGPIRDALLGSDSLGKDDRPPLIPISTHRVCG